MRTGIELGLFSPADEDLAGLLSGVLGALFADHPGEEFTLFCTRASTGLFPALPQHVERVVLPADRYFTRLDRKVARRRLDVLVRCRPRKEPLSIPLARQVVLIPDLIHESFPESFTVAERDERRFACRPVLRGAGAIATLSEQTRQTILAHPSTRCRDVFVLGPGSRADLVTRGPARFAQYDQHTSARHLWDACRRVAGATPPLSRLAWLGRGVLCRLLRSGLTDWGTQVRRRVMAQVGPQLGRLHQYAPRPLVIPSHYAQATPPDPAPLVSLVTPSFNQAPFLERTLQSVLGQQYSRLEYVVQDGGSKDGSVELLRRYGDRLAHWESAPDRGQAHALNLGFRHATGEILGYLNSDDLLLPGTLAYVASYFASHPEVDVVYGHRIVIDAQDCEVGRWVLPPHNEEILRWRDYVPQETLFWRRRLWERVGGRFDETFQFALDWDLLLRFQQAGARFTRLPRFLGAFRLHEEQKTTARLTDLYFPETRRLQERYHGRAVLQQEIAQASFPYLRRHMVFHYLYRLGLLRC